jgi:transposase
MIGLDIAKAVFQVHGEAADSVVVLQKRLRRSQVESFFAKLPPAVIGIEACGSAHYWGRTLRALGHDVRLIAAAYVKPFVRRNKTDARDAAAICAALGRPDMRFVTIKSVEQQASRGLERSRDLLVKQHTQLSNCIRSQLAELGMVAAQGRRGFAELARRSRSRIPAFPRCCSPRCACCWRRRKLCRRRWQRSKAGSWRWPKSMRRCAGSLRFPAWAG